MISRLFPKGSARREALYRFAFPVPARLRANFRRISPGDRERLEASLRREYFSHFPEGHLDSVEGRADLEDHLTGRMEVARRRVVPWLDAARPLRGATLLEIGCGTGSSTVAFAEQGARVTAIDVVPEDIDVARERCELFGVDATLVLANATEVAERFRGTSFDFIVLYASLEHMTHDERLQVMKSTWGMLDGGRLWCVVEAPNRLWYEDRHTSELPFFHWLPDDLALLYSRFSPRQRFREELRERTPETKMAFMRWGRGVSFHEFDVTMKPAADLHVVSCLPQFNRRRNPLLWLAWRVSPAYRYGKFLRKRYPRLHSAFFEELLYLIIAKN